MLKVKDDFDFNNVVTSAWNLIDYVVTKYKVTAFREFRCPFMKALAEDIYDEVEDGDNR